ncbi:MAG: NADH-quinone oxidoreductase subunit NuoH [Nitrososphaerota archaeon]|nr:NADH-quinone oxidoreductase subunit NuoH [Nitrososphaerota archaeon]MDG6921906.1 NADH-quinone oxidoreductase subunit NuoH [Nitrososphaerota archaeon]
MAALTNFELFVRRILAIVFWIVILIPLIIIPIFFIAYVLPVEFSCHFNMLNCSQHIDWSTALYLVSPAELNPFSSTSFISQIGLGQGSLIFKSSFFPGVTFAALLSSFVIWYERKLLAKMQYRVGPQYAGRVEGWMQSFADLFKLVFKEIVIPAKADTLFFLAVPFALMALSGALLAVIPISANIYISSSSYSLLIALAILSFFPLTTLLAGWASANKFSFIGGIRALYQMISYEIPFALSVVGVVILSGGTLSLSQIVSAQHPVWYILPMILGAIIFYVTAMAELERIPFDLPEADSEIVAGWLTEYSSMNFGVVNLATYIKLYGLSALFTILFLGGWQGPAPVPGAVWFMIKTIIVITVFLIPRGAFNRVRIDQLIGFGWLWLVALSIANIFIAVALKVTGIL